MEHFKAHRRQCKETCAIRANEVAHVFNEACDLQRAGNRAMDHPSEPDRKTGHAKWNAAIAKYQAVLALDPKYDAAREALVALLEWQEDAIERHALMCRELLREIVDGAADFAVTMCRAIVDDIAELATCRSSAVTFTAWVFKESRAKGVRGMASFRRWHGCVEGTTLDLYHDEKHAKIKESLDLDAVLAISTDFPAVDARAYPPAYTRLEVRTQTRIWILAVPPEAIGEKSAWIAAIAAAADLDIAPQGRYCAVKRGLELATGPREGDDDPSAGE